MGGDQWADGWAPPSWPVPPPQPVFPHNAPLPVPPAPPRTLAGARQAAPHLSVSGFSSCRQADPHLSRNRAPWWRRGQIAPQRRVGCPGHPAPRAWAAGTSSATARSVGASPGGVGGGVGGQRHPEAHSDSIPFSYRRCRAGTV